MLSLEQAVLSRQTRDCHAMYYPNFYHLLLITLISFALPGGNAGLFPIASRMNHACHPSQNIDFFYDTRDCYLVFVVKAETVKAGQELTICYGSNLIPIDLVCRYGFRCECGCCPGVGEDQINRMENW